MNGPCKQCGSWAVNAHAHGRAPGVDLDLCDVCYWRSRAEHLDAATAGHYRCAELVAAVRAANAGAYVVFLPTAAQESAWAALLRYLAPADSGGNL